MKRLLSGLEDVCRLWGVWQLFHGEKSHDIDR
jgi:hypothetical protein